MKINDKHTQKGFGMKDNLIQSAIRLFSRKGYDGTSIKDITDDSGTPKSLFYHYFLSKDELLDTIVRQYDLHVTKEEKDAIRQKTTGDGFGNIISRIYLKLQEEPEILKLIVLEALKNEKIMKAFMEKIDTLGGDFKSVIPEDVRKATTEEELTVFRIYFRFAPIILFSLTKDAVSQYYGYSPELFERQFLKLLKYNPFLYGEKRI